MLRAIVANRPQRRDLSKLQGDFRGVMKLAHHGCALSNGQVPGVMRRPVGAGTASPPRSRSVTSRPQLAEFQGRSIDQKRLVATPAPLGSMPCCPRCGYGSRPFVLSGVAPKWDTRGDKAPDDEDQR